jgi:hypothetical protein
LSWCKLLEFSQRGAQTQSIEEQWKRAVHQQNVGGMGNDVEVLGAGVRRFHEGSKTRQGRPSQRGLRERRKSAWLGLAAGAFYDLNNMKDSVFETTDEGRTERWMMVMACVRTGGNGGRGFDIGRPCPDDREQEEVLSS